MTRKPTKKDLEQRIIILEEAVIEAKRLQEALTESEEKYRILVENATDIIYRADALGRITFFNPAAVKLTGYVEADLIGKHYTECIRSDRRAETERFYGYQFIKNIPITYHEFPLLTKDNIEIWLGQHVQLITEDGQVIGFQAIARDITERKKMENAMRASEERYRTIIETIQDGYVEQNLAGKITFMNDMISNHLGYSREELIGKNSRMFQDEVNFKKVTQFYSEFYKTGKLVNTLEMECIRKDRTKGVYELSLSLMKDEQGKPIGFRCISRDITERKQKEEMLLLIKKAVEDTSDAIGLSDPQGNHFYNNKAFTKLFGYTAEELHAKGGGPAIYADMNLGKTIFDTIKGGGSWSGEAEFLSKSGNRFPTLLRADAIKDDSGRVIGLIGIHTDITRQKRTEEALRKSEAYFRAITENSSDLLLIADAGGALTYASPSVERIAGYHPNEVIGKSIFDFVIPDDLPKVIEEFVRALQTKDINITHSCRVRHKNGAELFIEGLGMNLLDDPAIAGFVMTAREITERKRAEEALRKSEEKFRKMTEASNIGISIIDGERIIYVNPMARKMSGFSEEEYLSKPILDFVTAESKELIRRWAMDRLAGKPVPDRYEFSVLTKDGGIKWTEAGAALIEYNGKPASIFTLYDITDRKAAEAEKQSLQEQLIRAQKMEALGQLAGGVAHDLNNVLGVLSGYSELLMAEIPEGRKAKDLIEKILRSTEKGAAIIQDLLTLARRGVTTSETINLNTVVSSFLKTPAFENMKDYHSGVTFRIDCQGELLNIKGSPVHLEKTLMNLLYNAAESISGHGEVTIRTENRHLDKAVRGYDAIKEGDYVVLTVSDTGMGIPDEHKDKIFEPFYTKKKMGRSGTGLGLAIVWGTVKDHNGYINVQTKVGKGTTFTLYFPITRDELAAPYQKAPLERYMGRGESVLIVDDIAEQRDVASGLLKKLGYEVHTVPSGEEAVEYFKGNKADILVLDMIMEPGIDGLETYQRILRINPKQKAILVSGFSETDRVRKAQKLGAGAYVRKPYVMEKIGMTIRDELKR